MFTGLVRDLGTIRRIEQRGDVTMEIKPSQADFPIAMGASIACHGICLTVTSITADGAFTADLSAETLRVTNAGDWAVGQRINLEPSLKVGDEIGGHFVSGHVDGLGNVVSKEPSGDSTVWTFEAPAALMKFIAQKGSIVVNGVSLTVNAVGPAALPSVAPKLREPLAAEGQRSEGNKEFPSIKAQGPLDHALQIPCHVKCNYDMCHSHGRSPTDRSRRK